MKSNFLILILLSLILLCGCQKKELANPDQARVVNLNLTGVSPEILEFIYKDSVVATTNNNSLSFSIKSLLAVDPGTAKLDVRVKGSTEILKSETISEHPYNQSVNVYYDGNKLYDGFVTLVVKGYVLSGELEFVSNGKVIFSGTGAIDNFLSILIDKSVATEIQVRKKGETAVLYTKKIEVSPAQQSLNFFFDGTSIVGNVQLDPPVNPENMMIKAKFQTTFPNQYKGVDVDLVFYTRLASAAYTVVGTKVVPELRFKLPKDGSFNTLELPPLPGSNYIYSFDIVESGTSADPYTYGTPLVLNGYTVKPNEGRVTSAFVNDGLKFEAGKSKLLVIQDGRTIVPASKTVYISGGKTTDLSQYFQ